MEIKFTTFIKNNYVYDLEHYLNQSYQQKASGFNLYILPMGKEYDVITKESGADIIDVPGMGHIMIQVLGEDSIKGSESAAHKSVRIEEVDGEHKIITEAHSYTAIVRYQNKELYCKFDDTDVVLNLEIDKYGTLTPLKISNGSYVLIKIPKISIKSEN